MIAEAIQKIIDIAGPDKITLKTGHIFTAFGGEVQPLQMPLPETLFLETLTSLIEYTNEGGDRDILHVKGPDLVDYIPMIRDEWGRRAVYARARNQTAGNPGWMSLENFIIYVRTCFIPDEATESILRVVGNIEDGEVVKYSDDGVTQAVTVKSGISMRELAAVPAVVALRPYRTFFEIEQPRSLFLLRMASKSDSPNVALFEADGGMWRREAILSIAAYLKDKTKCFVLA